MSLDSIVPLVLPIAALLIGPVYLFITREKKQTLSGIRTILLVIFALQAIVSLLIGSILPQTWKEGAGLFADAMLVLFASSFWSLILSIATIVAGSVLVKAVAKLPNSKKEN